MSIPAELTRQLRSRLKKQHPGYASKPDFFKETFRWTVYPKTDPVEFHLVVMRPLDAAPIEAPALDSFKVVGLIESCMDSVVIVRIQRNQQPPQTRWKHNNEWKSIILTLESSTLAPEAVGQIWEMEVQRSFERLVIKAGQPYEPSAQDLAWLEKEQSIAEKLINPNNKVVTTNKAPSPDPNNEPKPKPQHKTAPQQLEAELSSDSKDTPHKSPATVPTPDATNADITLTKGKMEVVVKLNQFPDDVRTVDKGWKEFVVDTGSAMVTITVKPKVFAALEQAKLDYANWVAAISGQMGAPTATGFRLESAAIKVFERQAKSQPEQTMLKDNALPATETPPSPPAKTQFQQQAAKPLAESPSQPMAVADPMQRSQEHLQQQRPTKTPLKRNHNQQRDNIPPVGKQQRDPISTAGNHTTTANENSQQSHKPRFSVTIDGRVFSGFDSVTLNKRMVCVDGQLVGQAKMVVVLGQPVSMQADGEVRQGRNQAVLTSR